MISRRQLLTAGTCLVSTALPYLLWHTRRLHGKPLGLRSDPKGLLDLAPGLTYRVIDRAGEAMSDGFRVPAEPDGMACFSGPDGTLVLMRNHELDLDPARGAYDVAPEQAYDRATFGGVTRVVLSPHGERLSSNLVLAGTLRNCSGGASPWGWLSGEETMEANHGYVFRCSPTASTVQPAERIMAYGRFMHEAVCVDTRTNVAYMTEDQSDGCFYRFVPTDPKLPFEGKLQALCVSSRPGYDTGLMREGDSLAVSWVDVPEPNPELDTVRFQALERGAALVRRGEGVTFHEGSIYISATIGGEVGLGQILHLRDSGQPRLEVVATAQRPEALEMPDNITVTPWGDLILAEDGLDKQQFVRGITPAGKVYDIARNAASGGELSGVCLSPDQRTLFINMQHDGLTVAITGPLRTLSA